MYRKCVSCKKEARFLNRIGFKIIHEKEYCPTCAEQYVRNGISSIQMTTTHTIDGYKVKRYIDIESVEIVIGTGIFSEISGEISDFFGERTTSFEKKLQKAKSIAFDKLRFLAFQKEGNAVLGIDIDYTEFSGNRVGLVVNGTIVALEPEPKS